jgi:hypothetical protein
MVRAEKGGGVVQAGNGKHGNSPPRFVLKKPRRSLCSKTEMRPTMSITSPFTLTEPDFPPGDTFSFPI